MRFITKENQKRFDTCKPINDKEKLRSIAEFAESYEFDCDLCRAYLFICAAMGCVDDYGDKAGFAVEKHFGKLDWKDRPGETNASLAALRDADLSVDLMMMARDAMGHAIYRIIKNEEKSAAQIAPEGTI